MQKIEKYIDPVGRTLLAVIFIFSGFGKIGRALGRKRRRRTRTRALTSPLPDRLLPHAETGRSTSQLSPDRPKPFPIGRARLTIWP